MGWRCRRCFCRLESIQGVLWAVLRLVTPDALKLLLPAGGDVSVVERVSKTRTVLPAGIFDK